MRLFIRSLPIGLLSLGQAACSQLWGGHAVPNPDHTCVADPTLCAADQSCDAATGACLPAVPDMASSLPVVRLPEVACDAGSLVSALASVQGLQSQLSVIPLSPGCVYTLTGPNNYWLGPTGLPPVNSPVEILGNGAVLQRDPSTSPFRFFVVAPSDQGTSSLVLRSLTLKGGLARGGNSGAAGLAGDQRGAGGGGAGLGGAIFSMGKLVLDRVSIVASSAIGGDGSGGTGLNASYCGGGGGGMGGNGATCRAQGQGGGGGGFHDATGGNGGNGLSDQNVQHAEGGGVDGLAGVYIPPKGAALPAQAALAPTTVVSGKGDPGSLLGGVGGKCLSNTGVSPGAPGTGGSGGCAAGKAAPGLGGGGGGPFHSGGNGTTQTGAGIGGGGGAFGGGGGAGIFTTANSGAGGGGGGGGFGGGGGGSSGLAGTPGGHAGGGGGGFGGGGGGGDNECLGGFGGFGGGGGTGANDPARPLLSGLGGYGGGDGVSAGDQTNQYFGGGGLGAGGAVFAFFSSLTVVNSTLAGNQAQGGSGGEPGAGLGGAIFSLHGSVSILQSSILGNKVATGTALAGAYRPAMARIAAKGSAIFSVAIANSSSGERLSLSNSVVVNNSGGADLANDSLLGGQPSFELKGRDLVGDIAVSANSSYDKTALVSHDSIDTTLNGPSGSQPVWIPDASSPAVGAGTAEGCSDLDVLRRDELDRTRPSSGCTLGAVEVLGADGGTTDGGGRAVGCGYTSHAPIGVPASLIAALGALLGLLARRRGGMYGGRPPWIFASNFRAGLTENSDQATSSSRSEPEPSART